MTDSPAEPFPHDPIPVLPVAPASGHAQPLALAYASAGLAPYVSAAGWARTMVRWMWVVLLAQVALLWPTVITLLNRVAGARGGETPDAIEHSYAIAEGIARILSLTAIVVIVYWMMWVYRTYRNLPALGAEGLRFSPGWAVLYYFIPIVHLVRPFQVMHETWRASDPDHSGGMSWRALPKARAVTAWWVMRLTIWATAFASAGFELYAVLEDDVEQHWAMVTAAAIDLFTVVVAAAVVVVEIRIVERVTEMQELRAGRVGTMPAGRGA